MCRSEEFYGGILSWFTGRVLSVRVELNFFGHQLSIHHVGQKMRKHLNYSHPNSRIPVDHFGDILNCADWHIIEEILRNAPLNIMGKPERKKPRLSVIPIAWLTSKILKTFQKFFRN